MASEPTTAGRRERTTGEEGPSVQRRGRPRSLASEQAILAATLDLIAEGLGPAAIAIGAIARRAGCGKDTIYRRWPCKEDLLLDALASQQRPLEMPPDPALREGLVAPLAELIGRLQNERDRRILRSLHGAGDDFPKLRDRYHHEVIEPRRERVRALVRAGVARGELPANGDLAQLAMMPFAAVVMSALEEHPVRGNPRRAAERMIDAVLRGIATRAPAADEKHSAAVGGRRRGQAAARPAQARRAAASSGSVAAMAEADAISPND